jgi:hypothetical protein
MKFLLKTMNLTAASLIMQVSIGISVNTSVIVSEHVTVGVIFTGSCIPLLRVALSLFPRIR